MLYAMLAAAWGDDDDEELGNNLDNLSNFTVERSIPVKLGEYVLKLPVGFGPPQLAWLTGGVLNRWASGRYTGTDAVGELAKGWVKSFAPVSPSDMELSKRPVDFFVQTFMPTVFKPLANIAMDQNNFGSPLTPMFKDPDKLKSEQAMRNTPSFYSDIAVELEKTTGIDLYPDHIKALVNGYMVGPINQIVKLTVEDEAKKLRGEPASIPVFASIIDNINDRQVLNSIYSRVRNDLDGTHRKVESLRASGGTDQITPEMLDIDRAYTRFVGMEKLIGGQRSALRKMELEPEEMSERVQAVEERADAARRRLLVDYFQTK